MDTRPVPEVSQLLDRHFRWRGREVSRLEGFSDAVFAIVLALLFLRAAPPETFADLKATMKGLVPFAATFAIVAWIWYQHWLFSRRYALRDGWTTFLNLLLLFLLLFYAYSLKFLFTLVFVSLTGPIGTLTHAHMLQGFVGERDGVALFLFYGFGYGSIFATLALMHWRALRLTDYLQLDRVERFLTRMAIVQSATQIAIAVMSCTLAATGIGLDIGLPGWIYGTIGPLMAILGTWQGRKMEQLLAARVS